MPSPTTARPASNALQSIATAINTAPPVLQNDGDDNGSGDDDDDNNGSGGDDDDGDDKDNKTEKSICHWKDYLKLSLENDNVIHRRTKLRRRRG